MHGFRETLCVMALAACPIIALAADDPYERYVRTSKDFRPVARDKAWCIKAFPSWTIMPWTYQWTIGYTDASGRWSVEHGYNGAFIDRAAIETSSSKTGRLDWINRFGLRFYNDHTAGKGDLHLWDGDKVKPHLAELHGAGVRSAPVNAAMAKKLRSRMRESIEALKSSPQRAAYALDDEVSWGHFVHPTMWRVTDDPNAYRDWLAEIYGPSAPSRPTWITYDAIRPKLRSWSVREFDASPLMDQWTFNDSYWNNFLGELVEYSNSLDPATPCGFVGGQSPNAFGGFDYAKLMRKAQFLEAYNIGGSQAIIRSFNPGNAIPTVTTHFHRSVDDDIWQTWYYLAHGNRGFISWVENWFDGAEPKPWHDRVAPTFLEAEKKIGPLLAEAEWRHDRVAIYYNHASIQLGWILDAEAHGKTWINRNGDERLGAAHHVRHAWENMLRDSGLQYSFINYADVIQHGVPREYRVLILPATLCLSECRGRANSRLLPRRGNRRRRLSARAVGRTRQRPQRLGRLGRGQRQRRALDDMFGVRHNPRLRSNDLFNGSLWCEVDQDANFNWKSYEEFLTNQSKCVRDPSGFHKVVREMPTQTNRGFGAGRAVLMNLSPQWYNAYRVQGFEAATKRETFMAPLREAGVKRWVEIKNASAATHGYEITYWTKGCRTIAMLCFNPEIVGSSTGGGNSTGLKSDTIPVTLRFAMPVKDARDERGGKSLGDGQEFDFKWTMNEAIVLSFVQD